MWALLTLLLLPIVDGAPAYGNERFPDYKEDYREFTVKDPYQRNNYPGNYMQQPAAHIFPNHTRCVQECEAPCLPSAVYLNDVATKMYSCTRLKPKKDTLIASIWGNSFYKTLVVLGAIVLVVLGLLTLAFCCSYCCRASSNSSRGSSKDALNPRDDDGEFREYMPEDTTSLKREFRRPPRSTLAV
ncbi:unnamed protein product, partial [Mesorhabditis spiculigera]